jgi:hypothetical protein
MKNGWNATITAAIACMLSAPLAIGPYAAHADELSDLRANQELLQQRLDQLAQVGTAKPQMPAGSGTIAGSFPRSFLIPGTETSIAVGGFVQLTAVEYLSGGNPNGNPGTPNTGGGGTIQSVPLDIHGQKFGPLTLTAAAFNTHSRGNGVFQMAARNSRLRVETRTPTAWGSADTVFEFDFYGCSSGGVDCDNLNHGTNPAVPRLRLAYGTLGGLIAGQNTVPVRDNAAAAELIDFGGSFGAFGYSRAPQLGYKMPVPWLAASLGIYAVDPGTEVATPVGAFETDSTIGIVGTFTPPPPTLGAAAGNPATLAFNNPAKSTMPDLNMVLEWQQPWGHFRLQGVVQKLELQDGAFVSKEFVGYGGGFAGNVRPAWFDWVKDNLGFEAWAGDGLGRYAAGSGGGSNTFQHGLATNYGLVGGACVITTGVGCYGNGNGGAGSTTAANGALVRAATVSQWGGQVNYQHWWTPTLRSTADFGIIHQDLPISLVRANATTAGYNKELLAAHLNLLWSPVPFVDTGFEYIFGHRVTLANTKGDDNTISYMFKVKF